MTLIKTGCGILLSVMTFCAQSYAKDSLPELTGSYMGQTPPGDIPIAFAPGLVSTEHWEYGGTFTPDLQEFYYLNFGENDKQQMVVIKNINNQWQKAVMSPRQGTPVISPDGKTMHLGKRYKTRTETGWSEIKSLGAPFDELPIMRLSVSLKGTYFMDEFKSDFTGAIRYSRLINGKHQQPRLLAKNINAGKSFHPFIAPDESYLIFDGKREGGYGDSDLYISYRLQDGSWGEPVNLGDKINTDAWEAAASVTPDGKYLLFNRNVGSTSFENVDIFWVDAGIIETLRPKI
ncbi:TolB family protein [Neptunicella marina]|uniref:PD40 domain-containing protein n=1 Tax=Neptunicella marina TaxID=2125989 RepID=A0A8J6IV58_9ALTE|nr:PD40 domain-containing protein [Neptunicella marina]MBC3766078.1 PD40 domain-containing protein [Neptunicella marina]